LVYDFIYFSKLDCKPILQQKYMTMATLKKLWFLFRDIRSDGVIIEVAILKGLQQEYPSNL
jgi:hypothetical protein